MPTVKTKSQLVSGYAAAVQAQAAGLVDLSIGSILRAAGEAVADVATWLFGEVLKLLGLTRAATSQGPDLDTWMADFNFPRLSATTAIGFLTFSRFSATAQAVVPVGAKVESADGSLAFFVTMDATNPAYSPVLGGYVMAPGAPSVTVPASAVSVGAIGNVVGGVATVITQALPGVDTVTNAAPFVNGADAETDPAFRLRFTAYLASLSRATAAAINYGISTLGLTVSSEVLENQDYAGAALPGRLTVIVDDGSGAPPASFLSAAAVQVDAYRAAGTTFEVHPPVLVQPAVAMSVRVAPGYVASAVAAIVSNALTAFLDAEKLGQGLSYTRLIQVAYDASPGVVNVSGVTLNGAAADLTLTPKQMIRAGSIAVTGS